jgi:NADPH-dependent 2,4-dienoyl-CoA reductase/sulfur reductase-like enzyme/rhodanese-related sulfurtransferase
MIKVVIIGGMAAGCKAASRLSRLSSRYEITVIERKPVISFGSCGLPLYASGEIDFNDLSKTSYGVLRDENYFRDVKGVTVLTKTEVEEIDTEKNIVQCLRYEDNKQFTLPYDHLIFATGSKESEHNFSHSKSPKISSFHSPNDAKEFREMAQKGKIGKVVIIGGGFIGCELTEALVSLWGMETILIEKESSLLPKIIDYEISSIVENQIEKNGIKIKFCNEVNKVEINQHAKPVVYLRNGDTIESDFVFYNFGVKPEATLAKESGIKTGELGGILVNEKLRTNIPNVWAAGDCVEIKNLVTNKTDYFSLGSLSNRMGRVVADSIAGENNYFKGAVGTFSLMLFNLIVSASGLTERKALAHGYDVGSVLGCWSDRPDYFPDAKNIFGKLIYEKSSLKLLGMQLTGEGAISRYIDIFSELLTNGKTVYDLINLEHGYTPAHSSPISPLQYFGYMVINQEKDGVRNVNPIEVTSFKGSFIDVREESEIEEYPFEKRSRKIPLSKLRKNLNKINNGKPIMFICQKGQRSYEAAKLLINSGNKNVSYLGGGVIFYNKVNNNCS